MEFGPELRMRARTEDVRQLIAPMGLSFQVSWWEGKQRGTNVRVRVVKAAIINISMIQMYQMSL